MLDENENTDLGEAEQRSLHAKIASLEARIAEYHELVKRSKNIRTTDDPMEGNFAIIDYIIQNKSKNLSFHSASSMGAWKKNQTGQWMRQQTEGHQGVIACMIRSRSRWLKAKTKAQ